MDKISAKRNNFFYDNISYNMSWIYLDKPQGIRSIQCLSLVKKKIQVKCGIWGILDEFACGLLPIATEQDTKNIDKYKDICQKQYIFTVQWGVETDTGDLTGSPVAHHNHRPLEGDITAIIPQFIGSIQQIPPVYSNIRINGVRAHQLARQGATVNMPPRTVEIFDLKLLSAHQDTATFSVWVGHGTYIRTLAMDMAQSLGTVGHLIYLRREAVKIDHLLIEPTITLDDFLKD
jgi:tRNA pseudouridine55 synthase